MKRFNILLLNSVILILLIIIIYTNNKSLFGFNTPSVTIDFLGFGKNDSNLTNIVSTCLPSDLFCQFPTNSMPFNLIHISKETNVYPLGISNTSVEYVPVIGTTGYFNNIVTYTIVNNNQIITCTDGDLLYTSDLTGITSYKIQYGKLNEGSPIKADYDNNIITIDTSQGTDEFSIKYVHNLINKNGLPDGTITINFPSNGGAKCACTSNISLGVGNNILFNVPNGSCTIAENIIIIPGQYGFDVANPNIKFTFNISNLSSCKITKSGRTGDASDWINNAIKQGYRTFNISEKSESLCYYFIDLNHTYSSTITASNKGLPDISKEISRTSCT
jgi:hypothetical protein